MAIFFEAKVVHTFDCVGLAFKGAKVVQNFVVGFSVVHTLDLIVGVFVVQCLVVYFVVQGLVVYLVVQGLVVYLVVHDLAGFSVVHAFESQLLKSWGLGVQLIAVLDFHFLVVVGFVDWVVHSKGFCVWVLIDQ